MKYYVFKTPRQDADGPVDEMSYEPTDFMIQQLAARFGPVIIVSGDEYDKQKKDVANENQP